MSLNIDHAVALAKLFQEFPELLNPDVNLEKEVYAHFGLLYMGFALLEHSLINIATIKLAIDEVKKSGKRDIQEWELAYDRAFTKSTAQTFGNLLKIVISVQEFHEINSTLERVKRVRDYFSHHFFRREASHMGERDSVIALLLDIRQARMYVDEVEASTRPLHIKYFKWLGIPLPSDEFIETGASKLRKDEEQLLKSNKLPRGLSRWLDRGREQ